MSFKRKFKRQAEIAYVKKEYGEKVAKTCPHIDTV